MLAQAAWLSAVSVLVWLALAPLAFEISDMAGVVAVSVAVALCWTGGALALAIAALMHGPAAAMHGMLLGMMARMIFPLMLGATLQLKVASLADAGMIYYLLVAYMVLLAVETVMMLARVQTNLTAEKAI